MNKAAMDEVTLQDGESANILNENIKQLKSLFPEVFGERGVNFETLRQLFGDVGVIDEGEEKYGLNWHGKKKSRQIALTPSTGTLLPCPEKSVDWDTTKNLFIEGDNLEVLKLLQKSYAGKVKMIYIDPPYNTGKEFIYPDRFQENLSTYLKYTGQIDDEGVKFSSNTETSGRMHTNWLNMIYPRLKLARGLLKKDGMIFISIDDNEQANLKQVCDEIFGEENFVANIAWEKRYTRSNNAKRFYSLKDSILAYRKSEDLEYIKEERTEKSDSNYSNPDNDPRGPWATSSYVNPATKAERKNLVYEIENPFNNQMVSHPTHAWKHSRDSNQQHAAENRLWWGKDGSAQYPRLKIYLSEQTEGLVPIDLWDYQSSGTTDEAGLEIKSLFNGRAVFDTPKPTKLINRMLGMATTPKSEDLVLDFFAGSSSTAHAVLIKNQEDSGNRRFISVQLPEKIDDVDFKNIAEISMERIRRASQKIRAEHPEYSGDLGFKAFNLASSNIKAWNPDRADLEETLLSHQEHLIEGRTEEDVLYELLLKRGIDLAVPIESRKVSGKNIYSIGYGVLFACLDDSISKVDVENVAQGILKWHEELSPSSDTHVFFRDGAFSDDVSKTNMAAILEQNGINHVRSL
ncbi:site-specific DNA-methyltransferase [Pseudomonas bubulae]|uniref:site-specific DNA-methyltransferase n=1 Tax=Pseudomonas bubulae TaxID=2316085 RepID=UPI002B1E384C|nr:site-specific DNA-methyltransferase [Pseudomonas bubulae]